MQRNKHMETAKCPLCKEASEYRTSSVDGNPVDIVICPKCKKLILEKGILDKLHTYGQEAKDEMATQAKNMTNDEALYIAWDHTVKTMDGNSRISTIVINKDSLKT